MTQLSNRILLRLLTLKKRWWRSLRLLFRLLRQRHPWAGARARTSAQARACARTTRIHWRWRAGATGRPLTCPEDVRDECPTKREDSGTNSAGADAEHPARVHGTEAADTPGAGLECGRELQVRWWFIAEEDEVMDLVEHRHRMPIAIVCGFCTLVCTNTTL